MRAARMPMSRWTDNAVALIAAALFGSIAQTHAADPVAAAPAETLEELWLAVSVNRQDPGVTLMLRRADGSLLAKGADFERWRFKLPEVAAFWHRGEPYYALDTLPGIVHELDAGSQSLAIQ